MKKNKSDRKELENKKEINAQSRHLMTVKHVRNVEQTVIKFVKEEELFNRGDFVVTALSGGPDSVFLLHILNKFKDLFGIRLSAFHLHHGIRGKSADEDLEFCKTYCKKLGVEFFFVKKNVKKIAEVRKISVEEAGRIVRYNELEKLVKKTGAQKIATGHIINDNTETVLLNLIKGGGLSALAGIPLKRGNIVRPILCISKATIKDYLTFNGIDSRFDESNDDTIYERNFIRKDVVPLIKNHLNPSLEDNIFRSSQILRKLNSFLLNYISLAVKDSLLIKEGNLTIKLDVLKNIDSSLYDFYFREVLNKLEVDFNYADVTSLTGLVEKRTGSKVSLSNGYTGLKGHNKLYITGAEKEKSSLPVVLRLNSKVEFENFIFSCSEVEVLPEKLKGGLVEYISGDKITGDFEIRFWKAGDKFKPLGMQNNKKVSDFLADVKIDPNVKPYISVVCNKSKIVWVAGLRISNDFKINPETKRIIKLWLSIKRK